MDLLVVSNDLFQNKLNSDLLTQMFVIWRPRKPEPEGSIILMAKQCLGHLSTHIYWESAAGMFKVLGHCIKKEKAPAFHLFYREKGDKRSPIGFDVAKTSR